MTLLAVFACAAILAAFLAAGFFVGLRTRDRLANALSRDVEARTILRLQRERRHAVDVSRKIAETKRKLREQHGGDLGPEHEAVVDEEIERILGVGPGDNGT